MGRAVRPRCGWHRPGRSAEVAHARAAAWGPGRSSLAQMDAIAVDRLGVAHDVTDVDGLHWVWG